MASAKPVAALFMRYPEILNQIQSQFLVPFPSGRGFPEAG
jgi:hypothetical protein